MYRIASRKGIYRCPELGVNSFRLNRLSREELPVYVRL
jgi:hypothetical protein